uniref:DUF4283 domain-containing protein n=1 Tax=Strongyloides papillosus TaxID=174720 RepID=A0A0N5CCU1_STREA
MATAKPSEKEVIQELPPSTDGVENPPGGGKEASDSGKEKEDGSKMPPRDEKSPPGKNMPKGGNGENDKSKSPDVSFPKKGKRRNTDREKSGTKKQPKELFSFEDLVKAMHSGEVQTLLNSYELPGIPHRGIMVKNICVPIVALLSDKEIRKGKIINREIVDLPTGRRHVANVGRIKTYESNVHDNIVTTLTSRTWEMVEFHAFTEGQQPLFKNGNTNLTDIWRFGQWTQIFK